LAGLALQAPATPCRHVELLLHACELSCMQGWQQAWGLMCTALTVQPCRRLPEALLCTSPAPGRVRARCPYLVLELTAYPTLCSGAPGSCRGRSRCMPGPPVRPATARAACPWHTGRARLGGRPAGGVSARAMRQASARLSQPPELADGAELQACAAVGFQCSAAWCLFIHTLTVWWATNEVRMLQRKRACACGACSALATLNTPHQSFPEAWTRAGGRVLARPAPDVWARLQRVGDVPEVVIDRGGARADRGAAAVEARACGRDHGGHLE